MLVALRYRFHDGGRTEYCTGIQPGHPRLPQQLDQPLPLHDHQQRRQGRLEEFLQLQQSAGSGE